MADLGALLEKLGRSAGLQNSEIAQLRSKGTALDRMSGSSSTLLDLPYAFDVDFLSARHGVFGTIPLEMGRIGTNTNQSIPNNTLTALTGADAVAVGGISRSLGIPIDTTNGQIDLQLFDSEAYFLVIAHVNWIGNTTGQRSLHLYNETAGTFIFAMSELDTNNPALGPQNLGVVVISNLVQRSIGLRVLQTSGGDLDVDLWRLNIIRIH